MAIHGYGASSPGNGDFEEAVLAYFRWVVSDYCIRMVHHCPVDLHVTFTVVTRAQLVRSRDEIERLAYRYIRRQLAADGRATVRFYINDRLAPPGYRVEVVPLPEALNGARVEALPPDGGPTEPAYFPASRQLRLTLRYGVLAWAGPLTPADRWIPIGRGLGFTPRHSTINLSDFGPSLPSGDLLQIRHWTDQVHIRRTATRPEYIVRLNGRQLSPGAAAAIDETGIVEYLKINDRSTSLLYELTWEE